MTREDIIRMAREAGCFEKHKVFYFASPELEAFAALIAAASEAKERDAVEDLLKEYDMVNSAFAKDFRARGQA